MKKATRSIPIVFVDGPSEKVKRIRALLPDAGFARSWEALGLVLERALATPPREPIVPGSLFDPYAGRTLSQKLGIRDGAKVALVGAPRGFETTLGELPAGVAIRRGARGASDLALVFVKTKAELAAAAKEWARRDDVPMFWFAWPKKSAGGALSEDDLRAAILPKGLVDSKVCALDATWGALRLSRRKTTRR